MKSFSYYLKQSERKEWSNYYLDYCELKNLIAKFGERRSRINTLSSLDELERFIDTTAVVDKTAKGDILHQNGFMYGLVDTACAGQIDDELLSSGRQNSIKSLVQMESSESGVAVDTTYESQSRCFVPSRKILQERINDRVARYEREEFCFALDLSVEKVSKLYLEQINSLEQQLALLAEDTTAYQSRSNSTTTQPQYEQESQPQQSHQSNTINTQRQRIDTTTPSNATTIIITTCSSSLQESSSTHDDKLLLQNRYKEIGDEILELYVFIGSNITALRQILIRYDSIIRLLDGPPLTKWYMLTRGSMRGSQFEAMLHHRDLEKFVEKYKALSYAMKDKMVHGDHDEKYDLEDGMITIARTATNTPISQKIHLLDQCRDDITLEIFQIESNLLTAQRLVEKSSRGKIKFSDSMRYYLLLGSTMNDLVLTNSFLRTRGVKLKKEIMFFARWRKTHSEHDIQRMNFPQQSKKTEILTPVDEDASLPDFNDLMSPSLCLIMVSMYLYTVNHYIIEPSSAMYVKSLGGNEANAGILIGITPWAAIMAAFVYSLWSNKSYRQPMLCSSICLSLGALAYALADKYSSLELAFVGRFITGMGGPCALLMRYIADMVPKRHRTPISAVFMTISALGMSCGPGFAVILDFLDLELNIPIIGEIHLNGLTGPGYLMFSLWSVFTMVVFWKFKDGERKGLQELEKEEDQYTPPNSPLSNDPNTANDTFFVEDIELMPTNTTNTTATTVEEDYHPVNQEEIETTQPARLVNQATVICMILKLVGKLNLEVLSCSGSIITSRRFGWTIKNVGMLGFVNGCLVVPIAMATGYLSQYYTDWTLFVRLQLLAFIGVFLLIDITDDFDDSDDYGYNEDSTFSVGPSRYVLGQIIQFCGCQASQSIVLSMLSKVVPLSLAKGTFNSGFIASVLTSLARAVGDFFIACMGFVSLRHLLNLLAVPCLIMTFFCILLSYFYRHKLSV